MVSAVRDGQRRRRLRPAIVGDRRSGLHLRGDGTVGSRGMWGKFDHFGLSCFIGRHSCTGTLVYLQVPV